MSNFPICLISLKIQVLKQRLQNKQLKLHQTKKFLHSKASSKWKCNLPNGEDTPSGPVIKNLPASAGDTGWIRGPGRFRML